MKNSKSENSRSNLKTLKKVFQIGQRNLAAVGVHRNLTAQSFPLNDKIAFGIFIYGAAIICIFKYTFYEAKTFIEYTQSMYLGSLAVGAALVLSIMILNVKKLFEYITACENIANTSEQENPN